MEKQVNQIDFALFRRVLALAKPYRGLFIASGALALLMAPVSVIRPYLIQLTVDRHIITYDFDGLVRMLLILFGVVLLSGLMRYGFIYMTSLLGQSVIKDLRIRVFEHITKLKLTYFDRTPIGKSTTRTISDIETINSVFSQGVITIVADVLTVLVVISVMLYTSVKLTLICLLTLPILLVATYIFKEKVKAAFQVVRTRVSDMNAFLQERISGMRIVQIFNAEVQEFEKFDEINSSYLKANLDTNFYYAVFFPIVEFLSASALALMIWWGARGILTGDITPGVLVAFPMYLNMLFRPVRMLADKFNTLQMGLIAAQRVFNILDTDLKIEDKGSIDNVELKGDVAFENVVFEYVKGEPVLKNVSVDIKRGNTMAVVGSTGSGKTTLINILNRFYEINGGRITVDGRDVRDYSLDFLRKNMVAVLQDVFLFSGTVYENIVLRDRSISKESAIEAAKTIGAHEFIMKLPGGYDYQVRERGATLSMGQRQLISFVRALVFDPAILILDEATSSIDPETESVIQHAIETLITKRTSIIIAHRLSTIRHADHILVMHKGEVAEYGTPSELLENEDGHYRQLHDMQFAQLEV